MGAFYSLNFLRRLNYLFVLLFEEEDIIIDTINEGIMLLIKIIYRYLLLFNFY